MNICEVLYTICAANDYKPYPSQLPKPSNGVVYNLISNKRRYSLNGDSKFHTAAFQITVFNNSKKEADRQMEELIDIFYQSVGTYDNIQILSALASEENEDFEEQTKLNVKIFDLTITYKKLS